MFLYEAQDQRNGPGCRGENESQQGVRERFAEAGGDFGGLVNGFNAADGSL